MTVVAPSPVCPDGLVLKAAALLGVDRPLLAVKPTVRGIETNACLEKTGREAGSREQVGIDGHGSRPADAADRDPRYK
jgi:hypothetical protein